MANYKNRKRTNKKGIATAIGALALSAILLAGGVAVGYGAGTHWTYNRNNVQTTVSDGMQIDSRKLARAEFEEYGISAQADSAYILTATIEPANADDRRVEWSVAPVSGNVNVSDYITLTANGLTATIACKQAFNVQFIVTVKSLDNPEAKATCTLDYVERVTGLTVNVPKMTSTTATVTCTPETSKYTIASERTLEISNFQFNDEFAVGFLENFDYYSTPYVRPLFPDYQNQLLKYTDTGLEFINGSGVIDFGYDLVCQCMDGLIGCLFAYSGQELDAWGWTEADIISYFISNCSYTYLGTVDVTVTSTYNGTTYGSITETVEVWVDGTAFHVPVTGISFPNGSSIRF